MATIGLIQVPSPKMTITTSSNATGNFFGDLPSGPFDPYSFPFPGKITKVLVNAYTSFGSGSLQINQHADSGSGDVNLTPALVLAAGLGIQEFVVDYPFNANDGFQFEITASNVGAEFSIILQVEYDLI
jgi:hypothetical protein